MYKTVDYVLDVKRWHKKKEWQATGYLWLGEWLSGWRWLCRQKSYLRKKSRAMTQQNDRMQWQKWKTGWQKVEWPGIIKNRRYDQLYQKVSKWCDDFLRIWLSSQKCLNEDKQQTIKQSILQMTVFKNNDSMTFWTGKATYSWKTDIMKRNEKPIGRY